MTDWTPKDTEALTGLACCDTDEEVLARAAAHIEALEARVAELEHKQTLYAEALSEVAIANAPGKAIAMYESLRRDALVEEITRLRAMNAKLQARIATLEAELADTIPRAVLVGSLRKRLRQATAPGGASCSSDMRRDAIAETLRGLIREIERGEWPGEGER